MSINNIADACIDKIVPIFPNFILKTSEGSNAVNNGSNH